MKKFREAQKSELDAQRELLDSLMGMNRNNDRLNQVKDFRDEQVCKFFLTGMCPHGNKLRTFLTLLDALLISIDLAIICRPLCEHEDGRGTL
ncbi:hypothetical protein EON65_53275 [archaeon]|nr:MAG: hypothetical protein EON65_53275 [archaeon]